EGGDVAVDELIPRARPLMASGSADDAHVRIHEAVLGDAEGDGHGANGHGANGHGLVAPARDTRWLANADMIREVATEPVIWGCTTCGWCEEGCPVAIEHIQRIVDMRRHAVLVRSEFPSDLAKSFKSTENQSNPWGIPADTRADWA